MDKRHRKFFYAFLLFNCFLSPACNHEKHSDTHNVRHSIVKVHN